jgi:hypothetical protein
MTTIIDILRNVLGLFLDDEFLAIAVLVVVAVTSFLILGLGAQPSLAGGFLLFGNIVALTGSVVRTARQSPRR